MVVRIRRTGYYLLLVAATTVSFTLLYNFGMGAWEGRPQPMYRSLEVVVQSFTTTGYGDDAPWATPQMNGLVIAMQLAGIGLILTAVDVFAVPAIRDALTPSPPRTVPKLEDHVVVCVHTPRTEAFISELAARDDEYVLIVPDADHARELNESEYRVLHGDPESVDILRTARIDSALAVVVDAADDTSASVALSVREVDPDVRVITLVEDATLARYHRAAGVDDVLSPRKLLGERLAAELPTAVKTDIEEGIAIGEDFELVELTVAENSAVRGRTFEEAGLRERFGVNVVGAWFDGDFTTPVRPTDRLAVGTQLLVVGRPDRVETLRDLAGSRVRAFASQEVIVAGYGDSGRAAVRTLRETSSRSTVLDVDDDPNVDVVGDTRDPNVLERAGIHGASALVVAVGDDTTAIFATLIAREMNPDLRVVVRANEVEDVPKLYRAGADYVQSLAAVSGRMLVSTVFESETILAYEKRVSVVRLPAPGLDGRTAVDAEVRSETGCTVVAVVRDGKTVVDFDPAELVFRADDEVVVAGEDDAIARFEDHYGD
jgi:Trk K+ transport system NAD-binding subunit